MGERWKERVTKHNTVFLRHFGDVGEWKNSQKCIQCRFLRIAWRSLLGSREMAGRQEEKTMEGMGREDPGRSGERRPWKVWVIHKNCLHWKIEFKVFFWHRMPTDHKTQTVSIFIIAYQLTTMLWWCWRLLCGMMGDVVGSMGTGTVIQLKLSYRNEWWDNH